MKKKTSVLIIIALFLSLIGCGTKIDLTEYNSLITIAQEKTNELDSSISESEQLIESHGTPLDSTLTAELETAISDAKATRIDLPTTPETETELLEAVTLLQSLNYDTTIETLENAKTSLEKSIYQYSLVDAPTESYIISCLNKVHGIIGISAVTEDNDPNGQLNKAGGYIAQVYFLSNLVNQTKVPGNSIIEKGTNGGGSIEVYSTLEDAQNRNDYLSTFDGSPLASGSHTVIGTVIIRTSHELTASQQKDLEQRIVDSLLNETTEDSGRTISGYNLSSNQTITIDGLSITIPAYFDVKDELSTAQYMHFYPSVEEYYCSLIVTAESLEIDKSTFETMKNDLVTALIESWGENIIDTKLAEININNLNGVRFSCIDAADIPSLLNGCIIFNPDTNAVITIIQSFDGNDASNYDYVGDFEKLLNSIQPI